MKKIVLIMVMKSLLYDLEDQQRETHKAGNQANCIKGNKSLP